MTKNGEIVKFKHAFELNGKPFITGSQTSEKHDFFVRPFRSRYLNIFESDCTIGNDRQYSLNQIKCKMFCLPFDKMHVFIPLLHSIDVFDKLE